MNTSFATKVYARIMRVASCIAQPLTDAALHNSHRVRVLVIAEGKVLLQRTSVGTQEWSLPGGGIENGESPTRAVTRETYEETGISIKPAAVQQLGQWRGNNKGKKWPQVNLQFYLVVLSKTESVRRTRPLEILEVGWFELDDIPLNHSKTIDRALSFYGARTQH